MKEFSIVYVVLFALALCALFLLLAKNEVTWRNHNTIQAAIYRLRVEMIENGKFNFPIHYEDMESYNKTLFRLWDWGCSRILPPEKFELVKPYIK